MPDTIASTAAEQSPIPGSLWIAALFTVVLLLIFHVTTWSMVSIWLRSDTFAHGFLILPISLWLIWSQRDRLRGINAKTAPWVALLMLPIGFGWLLATLVDVLVIQQLALVALLVVGVWAILGHELARLLAFPLLFLFLAVPMGEALVPPMMEFTATSTVWLIQQTGVPVYREGLYFTLPSGNWSVVEACSGVRYIIASVTLGLLYAYLTYCSFWRRALFVLASIIVPVFANTVRAYIIVMLGHLSDMKVATGVDHLIYGWVFFGLVMFLLFWLGSFFRDDHEGASAIGGVKVDSQPGVAPVPSKPMTTALFALLLAAVWLFIAGSAESRLVAARTMAITPPAAVVGWSGVIESPWRWEPVNAVAKQAAAFYQRDAHTLGLFIQYRMGEGTRAEVVGSSTRFANEEGGERVIGRDRVSVEMAGRSVMVDQALLSGYDGQLLAWSWYRVGDLHTSNDYVAKFREALGAIGWGHARPSRIVLVMPLQESIESTHAVMEGFLQAHFRTLDAALDSATPGEQ